MKEIKGLTRQVKEWYKKLTPYRQAFYPLSTLPFSVLMILSGFFFRRGDFSGSAAGAVWLLIYVLMGGTAYVTEAVWAFDRILSILPYPLQREKNEAQSRVLWYLLYLILCYGGFCQVGVKEKALFALGIGFALCRCFYILYTRREDKVICAAVISLGILFTALIAIVSLVCALCLLDACVLHFIVFYFVLEKKTPGSRVVLGRYYLCGTDFILLWVLALLCAFLPLG